MIEPAELPAATAWPQPAIAPRRPGSVRRSSHIRLGWPHGDAGDPASEFAVHGAVRDVRTDATGAGQVVGEAWLRCTVTPQRVVTDIEADPRPEGLDGLLGRSARGGWRAAAAEVVSADTPLGLLLDDVPIAAMLSSYGALREGRMDVALTAPLLPRMRDICAGWASDATLMRTIDAGHRLPLPGLVPVPDPAAGGADPLATEPRPPLGPGELRRTRRLDVTPGAVVEVEADFRDVWCDATGREGVLHEYVVALTLSTDLVVTSVRAQPRVLPYDECSVAAAAPQRLVGRPIAVARDVVSSFAATASCTHLNDLVRSLTAVPALVRLAG